MPTQVHRDQQAFIRRMLEKRSHGAHGSANGSRLAMEAADAARRDRYEADIARMLADADALPEDTYAPTPCTPRE